MGKPPLAHASISTSSASIPSNHQNASITEVEEFALFRKIGAPRLGVTHCLWGMLANRHEKELEWSSESDICRYVTAFLEEVAAELNLPLKFRGEVGFFNLRPDISVIKAFGIPVGVVEVKKPGEDILSNGAVLGELYDYMKQIVNFYGLKEVFGILTTYEEWRICWLDNAESKKLAGREPEELVEPQSPSKDPESKSEGKSPPGLTPSKQLEKIHALEEIEEDVLEEPDVEKDDTKREMICTRVWGVDENVFNLVGSALWKMNSADFCKTSIGPAQMVIEVTEESFFWCKRPKPALDENLKWSKVPNAAKVLLLEDLGVGHSGRVWLVCSRSGLVGVLKFSVATPPKGESFVGKLEDYRKSLLEKELKFWQVIYPELGKYCCMRRFAGHWALLMPHLSTPQRNETSLSGVKKTLFDRFVKKKLKHGDVAWRNIGVYMSDGKEVYVVFDFESVSKSEDSDWVEGALQNLRGKT
jgi:hypothetical protein